MQRFVLISPVAIAVAGALSACSAYSSDMQSAAIIYNGVNTSLLVDDLVQFNVSLSGASQNNAVQEYAKCAAAQYTLIRGYGFARHVRTTVSKSATTWRADAIYSVSDSIPRGYKTIEAQVVADDCVAHGIPMV